MNDFTTMKDSVVVDRTTCSLTYLVFTDWGNDHWPMSWSQQQGKVVKQDQMPFRHWGTDFIAQLSVK